MMNLRGLQLIPSRTLTMQQHRTHGVLEKIIQDVYIGESKLVKHMIRSH